MKRHAEAFTIKPSNLQHAFFLARKSKMSKEEVKMNLSDII